MNELTQAEHLARLEADVAAFAQHLTAAQEDGLSPAVLLPRLLLAFRRSFGEPPPELDVARLLAG